MGRGILKGLLNGLEEIAAKLPEKRKDSNALAYEIPDALKSGLAVFYLLHPSLLNFQQEMRRKQRRDNLETLFGIKKYLALSKSKTSLTTWNRKIWQKYLTKRLRSPMSRE
jgi:hypothetical protein